MNATPILREAQLALMESLDKNQIDRTIGVRAYDLPIELFVGVSQLVDLGLVDYGWAEDGSSTIRLTDAGWQVRDAGRTN